MEVRDASVDTYIRLCKANKNKGPWLTRARLDVEAGRARAPTAFSAHASAVRRARASGTTKDNARSIRTRRYPRVDARETLRVESHRRWDPRGNPAARPRIVY